jgi:putative SOS response-associated peptidase YedK
MGFSGIICRKCAASQSSSGTAAWFLHPAEGEVALFAGLWDRWERGGEVVESCSIIVGPADENSKPYHDRAPYTVADAMRLARPGAERRRRR